jgi:hypothetical protein
MGPGSAVHRSRAAPRPGHALLHPRVPDATQHEVMRRRSGTHAQSSLGYPQGPTPHPVRIASASPKSELRSSRLPQGEKESGHGVLSHGRQLRWRSSFCGATSLSPRQPEPNEIRLNWSRIGSELPFPLQESDSYTFSIASWTS